MATDKLVAFTDRENKTSIRWRDFKYFQATGRQSPIGYRVVLRGVSSDTELTDRPQGASFAGEDPPSSEPRLSGSFRLFKK
jgi:hypothetical protein